MPEPQSSSASLRPKRGSSPDPSSEPLGWLSLAPSVSIAVFLLVAMFTLDSSGESSIILALIVGLLVGPPASYLLNTYWPAIKKADPSAPTPEAKS